MRTLTNYAKFAHAADESVCDARGTRRWSARHCGRIMWVNNVPTSTVCVHMHTYTYAFIGPTIATRSAFIDGKGKSCYATLTPFNKRAA